MKYLLLIGMLTSGSFDVVHSVPQETEYACIQVMNHTSIQQSWHGYTLTCVEVRYPDSSGICPTTDKITDMRITGYLPTGNKTALMGDVVIGYTAAVSPGCSYLLGEEVYVHGHGIRYINDLTSARLDELGICTLDLSVPDVQTARRVGNNISTVVRLSPY